MQKTEIKFNFNFKGMSVRRILSVIFYQEHETVTWSLTRQHACHVGHQSI
jgi:hypothetical protein